MKEYGVAYYLTPTGERKYTKLMAENAEDATHQVEEWLAGKHPQSDPDVMPLWRVEMAEEMPQPGDPEPNLDETCGRLQEAGATPDEIAGFRFGAEMGFFGPKK